MKRFHDAAFDWIAWAGFAAVPALIFWQCATSLEEQDVASGGPMENAAFYPRIVASVMVALLIWQAGRLVLGSTTKPSPFRAAAGTRLALATTALFVAYLVVLPYAGFHLATPVLCFLLFRLLGARTLAALVGGGVLSLTLAFVFEALLNVILPLGVFDIAVFN